MKDWRKKFAEDLLAAEKENAKISRLMKEFEEKINDFKKHGILKAIEPEIKDTRKDMDLGKSDGSHRVPFICKPDESWTWQELAGEEEPFPQYWDQIDDQVMEKVIISLIKVDCGIKESNKMVVFSDKEMEKRFLPYLKAREEAKKENEEIKKWLHALNERIEEIMRENWLKSSIGTKLWPVTINKEGFIERTGRIVVFERVPAGKGRGTQKFKLTMDGIFDEESMEQAWEKISHVLVSHEVSEWGELSVMGKALTEGVLLNDEAETGKMKIKQRL